MKAHELAQLLLAGPDLPVITPDLQEGNGGYDYLTQIESVQVIPKSECVPRFWPQDEWEDDWGDAIICLR